MDVSDKEIVWYVNKDGDNIYLNLKGKLHRLNGPAIESVNGNNLWYKEGKRHRENGPAIECRNGSKEWYKEGRCHRIDGPALEYSDGGKYWYILYKELEEEEFNSWMNRIKKFL